MSSEKETLFELVKQANFLSQALAESGGEITLEIEALMGHIDVKMPDKIDGYSFVMDALEKDAAHFKAKADLYAKVAKAHAALQDRIKDRLKAAMQEMGIAEIKGNDVRFKLAATAPRLVIDEAKLNKSYFIQVTETVPDKERIKEELKFGASIEGAELQGGFALRSYVNKKGEKS